MDANRRKCKGDSTGRDCFPQRRAFARAFNVARGGWLRSVGAVEGCAALLVPSGQRRPSLRVMRLVRPARVQALGDLRVQSALVAARLDARAWPPCAESRQSSAANHQFDPFLETTSGAMRSSAVE
jgi:hypothetical protein